MIRHPVQPLKDWRKVLRAANHVIANPAEAIRWLRFSVFSRKEPLDLCVPWWSFKAVESITGVLKPTAKVFEFGSGGSSIFMAGRVGTLDSVEDSPIWADKVRARLQSRALHNATIHLRPFDFRESAAFTSSEYLRTLQAHDFDLIIIDGSEYSKPVRDACFWKAEQHLKPGGVIVLDDSWRYPQVFTKNSARKVERHKGLGYCRLGVTETTIFYY
ncbi:MAG: hypothetical protein RLZZ188_1880 [Verrucomicrobiota bacterium]|jgi:SAM-dependent methyltransferase